MQWTCLGDGGVTQDAAFDFFEKNLTTELLHIFNECGVPVGLQYKLGQRFKNVKKFSTYADTRSDVRGLSGLGVGILPRI